MTLTAFKTEIQKEAKRVLKKEVPKSEQTKIEVQERLTKTFNQLSRTADDLIHTSSEAQKTKIKEIFTYCHKKVTKAFKQLNLNLVVPATIGLLITSTNLLKEEQSYTDYSDHDSDLNSKSSTGGDEKDDSVASPVKQQFDLYTQTEKATTKMDATTVIKLTTSVVSEYHGKHENLHNFLQQVDVISAAIDAQQENLAVSVVKSRIKNKILLESLENVSTIKLLKERVTAVVKPPSVVEVKARLANFKQSNSSNAEYAGKIKNITNELIETYLCTGIPIENAKTLALNDAIESIKINSNNEQTQLAMRIGSFNSIEEVLTKINSAHTAKIMAIRKFKNNARYYANGKRSNYKGRNFNPHYSSYKSDNRGRSSNYFKNNESRGKNKSNYNANNSRNVRAIESSKNGEDSGHQQTAGDY
jgi:hypothetical protein